MEEMEETGIWIVEHITSKIYSGNLSILKRMTIFTIDCDDNLILSRTGVDEMIRFDVVADDIPAARYNPIEPKENFQNESF